MDTIYRIARVLLTIATATTIGTCVALLGCSFATPIAPNATASNNATNSATANPTTSVTLQPADQPAPSK